MSLFIGFRVNTNQVILFRGISVNFDVLLVPKLYIYIPLLDLISDDVLMSRENRNFYLCLFVKCRALQCTLGPLRENGSTACRWQRRRRGSTVAWRRA
jgi:hypothetical protein